MKLAALLVAIVFVGYCGYRYGDKRVQMCPEVADAQYKEASEQNGILKCFYIVEFVRNKAGGISRAK